MDVSISSETAPGAAPTRRWHAAAACLVLALAIGLMGCNCGGLNQPQARAPRYQTKSGKTGAQAKRTGPSSRLKPEAPPKPRPAPAVPKRVAAISAAALQNTPLSNRVNALYLGKPVRHANLTLYPVEAKFSGAIGSTSASAAIGTPAAASPKWRVLTVDAAFAARKISITEEGSATVPFVKVRKPESDEVFIMTGEMFVGAQQDRISKHDVLLPKRAGRFRLPVYCVEQGRWGGGSRFTTGKVLSTRSLRKSAAQKRSQGVVWGKVAAKTGNVRAHTSTQTMHASYKSRLYRKKSPGYLKAFGPFAKQHPKAVGVLVVINNSVSNLDLFSNHDLFEKLWTKLLKALVLDAVDPHFKSSEFAGDQPQVFLASLGSVKYRPLRTPGLGREYLLSSPTVAGSLLVAGPRVVHLALFPEREGVVPTRRFHTIRSQAPQVKSAPSQPGWGPKGQSAVQASPTKGGWKSAPSGKGRWRKAPPKGSGYRKGAYRKGAYRKGGGYHKRAPAKIQPTSPIGK